MYKGMIIMCGVIICASLECGRATPIMETMKTKTNETDETKTKSFQKNPQKTGGIQRAVKVHC